MAKLRKLLEDVHLEAEETSHMLRKKHQEAITDLQDQLEILAKGKAKYVFLLPFSCAFSVNQWNSATTSYDVTKPKLRFDGSQERKSCENMSGEIGIPSDLWLA